MLYSHMNTFLESKFAFLESHQMQNGSEPSLVGLAERGHRMTYTHKREAIL